MSAVISIVKNNIMDSSPEVVFLILKNKDEFELVIDSDIDLNKTSMLELASSALREDIDMSNDARFALETIEESILEGMDWVHELSIEEYAVMMQVSTVNDILLLENSN